MSATIQSIEAMLVDIPTIRPHQLSMTTMAVQTMVIVRMKGSDGLEGIGEATIGGLAYGPESPESVKLTIDTYFPPPAARSAGGQHQYPEGKAGRQYPWQQPGQVRHRDRSAPVVRPGRSRWHWQLYRTGSQPGRSTGSVHPDPGRTKAQSSAQGSLA
ncbi:hypothetical protein [Oceanisphaera arctica]|uniref:Mandelate racemase/muconate lactonizing enzyme N-terminal domain-containing protein n=1 Tax=Oceanisphaera arctica TaxID=641510 RepID=A0A2P5TRJ5_9GAMM|nr:hypothetical protein [Oceanisphaera arctica]PPL18403.1 hypothetical protein UN63_00210 [Oceanisphaera arctica]